MTLACSICSEDAHALGRAHVTTCGHVYCDSCARLWFGHEKQSVCSVCHQKIPDLAKGLIPLAGQPSGGSKATKRPADRPANSMDATSSFLRELEDSANQEHLQVRSVLGLMADRWQYLMVERAKFIHQIAELKEANERLTTMLVDAQSKANGHQPPTRTPVPPHAQGIPSAVPHGSPSPEAPYAPRGAYQPPAAPPAEAPYAPRGAYQQPAAPPAEAQYAHMARATSAVSQGPQLMTANQRAEAARFEAAQQGAMDQPVPTNPADRHVPVLPPRSAAPHASVVDADRAAVPREPPSMPRETPAGRPRLDPAALQLVRHKEERFMREEGWAWKMTTRFERTHEEPIHGVACGEVGDEMLVATACWDHTAVITELEGGRAIRTLKGHTGGIYEVALSHVRSHILGSASGDRSCRLWDLHTGENLRELRGHTDEVNSLSFSWRDNMLATGSDDTNVMIWDTEKGASLLTLTGHTNVVYGVCFQPEGPLVASVSFDHHCKIWDPRQASVVKSLEGHQDDCIGVDMSYDNNLLATGSDDVTCGLWDIRQWRPVHVIRHHKAEVKRVVFSPGSGMLATTSADKTCHITDLHTFECRAVLAGHSDHVFDAAWSPNSDFIVTASHDKTWSVWTPERTSNTNATD